MGKNRDRLSIIAAILEASRTGASKTHVMFQANLSFKLLEKYLNTAMEAGFIQLKDQNYQLTTSGQEFLMQYRAFHSEYSRVQASLEALGNERDKLDQQCSKSLCAERSISEGEI